MDGQNVQVTQVVENKGCLSGCGTAFAVLIVVGLFITYWYVAVPVAVVALAGGAYLYYRQQSKLPEPQSGPQDPWLDQVATRLSPLGFTEQTRNTGRQLETVPMEGDLCVDGDGLRIWVNVFTNAALAAQAAQKLRVKDNFREPIARGYTSVVTRGRLLFVANGVGGPVNDELLVQAMNAAPKLPHSSASSEPPQLEPPAQTRPYPDTLEQLRKLGELRDTGVLSPEEFEVKKAELLKRI